MDKSIYTTIQAAQLLDTTPTYIRTIAGSLQIGASENGIFYFNEVDIDKLREVVNRAKGQV